MGTLRPFKTFIHGCVGLNLVGIRHEAGEFFGWLRNDVPRVVSPLIKLSICIPTLNRGHLIGVALESVVSQLVEGVEVVVFDGASTDCTADLVQEFAGRCPAVRYVLGEGGQGVDHDIDQVVAHANGEYCWLFSDDDILKPGAIARVLEELAHGPTVLVINAEVRDYELLQVLEPSNLRLESAGVYQPEDAERLFREIAKWVSYLGAAVFKRAWWTSRDRAAYYGSDFILLGVLFQRPLEGTAVVLSETLIAQRYGIASWSHRSFEVSMVNWPKTVWSFTWRSPAARRAAAPQQPWRSRNRLFYLRGAGEYSPREYERFIRGAKAPRVCKALAWCLAAAPWPAVHRVARMYYSLPGRSRLARAKLRGCGARVEQPPRTPGAPLRQSVEAASQ